MAARASARGYGWTRLILMRPADLAVLLGIGSAAWLFDLAIQSGGIGVAFSASLVVAAGALIVAGRPSNGWSRLLLAAASVMAPWVTLRASPWLQWPDLIVTIALLSLGAVLALREAHSASRRPWRGNGLPASRATWHMRQPSSPRLFRRLEQDLPGTNGRS